MKAVSWQELNSTIYAKNIKNKIQDELGVITKHVPGELSAVLCTRSGIFSSLKFGSKCATVSKFGILQYEIYFILHYCSSLNWKYSLAL